MQAIFRAQSPWLDEQGVPKKEAASFLTSTLSGFLKLFMIIVKRLQNLAATQNKVLNDSLNVPQLWSTARIKRSL